MKKINWYSGQGMLEGLLAIGIILMGLGAILTLTLKNISAATDSGQKITAVHLARESIDAVRGVRDSNWLITSNSDPTVVWDSDLVPDSDDQSAVVTFNDLVPSFSIDFINSLDMADPEFKMHRHVSQHFWVQSSGVLDPVDFKSTGYQRLTLLEPVCEELDGSFTVKINKKDCGVLEKVGIKVTATVSWPASGFFGSGTTRSVSLEEYLYDWR